MLNTQIYCEFGIFREGFIFAHMRSFVKIKSSRIGEITKPFTDIGKSRPSCEFFYVANMCFNAIRENKMPARIPEFTM